MYTLCEGNDRNETSCMLKGHRESNWPEGFQILYLNQEVPSLWAEISNDERVKAKWNMQPTMKWEV